jgi:hypothetical protein
MYLNRYNACKPCHETGPGLRQGSLSGTLTFALGRTVAWAGVTCGQAAGHCHMAMWVACVEAY